MDAEKETDLENETHQLLRYFPHLFISQTGVLEYGVIFLSFWKELVQIPVGDGEDNLLIFIYEEERIAVT